MPEIHPIPAVRFAGVDDLSTCIAPPYDVLDEEPKQALLKRDPHNIVAIDLPVTPPKTVGPDEAYEQAGQTLRQWISEGVLARDNEPAMYAYEQAYTANGQTFARRGLFTNVTAEPFGRRGGGVHQHEHTIRGGIDDRTKLMHACRAQLSPVFSMFPDPRKVVEGLLRDCFSGAPHFRGTTGHDNVKHRCWRIPANIVTELQHFFWTTDVFIADGHHRYNTALGYAQSHPDQPRAQHCLMVLVACEDPGMIVLPTHRAITGLSNFKMDALKPHLNEAGFAITEIETPLESLTEQLSGVGHHAMALLDPTTGKRYIIATVSPDPLAKLLPDKAEVWRTLDVAVLHELLIDRILRPNFGGDAITYKYTADVDELSRLVDKPDKLGVIMQATPLQSVCDVSLAGEVMPPKSTFFFPKLATGLIINPLD